MTLIRLAHIINWMYGRDASGQQPKWNQSAGELAFWVDEPDEEIFLMLDSLGNGE